MQGALALTLFLLPSFGTAAVVQIDADGASITRGERVSGIFFSRRPLEELIRAHLPELAVPDDGRSSVKVLIAFDYFFPTNFSELRSPEADIEGLLESIVGEWLNGNAPYDYVLIGNLIDRSKLRERRFFDKSCCADHAVNIRNLYRSLHPPAQTSSNADRVANTLREIAERSSEQVILIEHERLLNNLDPGSQNLLRSDGGPPIVPTDLFTDAIHINLKGQAYFFNEAIKPALEKIPGLERKIPFMAIE